MCSLAISILAAVPEPRVFGLDQQTVISILIQLLNACVLAAVLSFLLYKPVRNFMQKRAEKIQSELDRAKDSMDEANKLKTKYEKKLREIESERVELLDKTREIAAEKSKQMTEETKKEINLLKERARTDIQRERENLKEEVGQNILEVSAAMAGKFVMCAIDKETQDKIFEETIAELEEAAWSN